MKIVDLSHVMNVHTPGWVGYAGNKMYYAQNMQTQTIVAQRIETALHVGTHFDGAMHATDGRKGDMASLPLDYLCNQAVVVDLSDQMTDWSVITPEMIEQAGADIREGDILILHTGWHRYYEGQQQQDLVRYFCFHPGPNLATMHWMLQEEDQMVRHGHRVVRPRHEHVDPHHAARSRRAVHARSSARRRRNSSGRSSTRTSSPAGASPPTSFRCTAGHSRRACCTPRISAATSSWCSASAA